MQRHGFRTFAYVVVVHAIGCFACSDDEQSAGSGDASTDRGGTGAIEVGASGGSASGGTAPNGTGATTSGGDGSVGGAGGTGAGGSNTDASPGASGGTGGQLGSEAGLDGSAPVGLDLCVRLTTPSVFAFDITRAFDHAVFADCRVKWVVNLYLDVDQRAEFLNNLLAWNMQFWGCNPPPPSNFGLIFKPAPLTSADAAALVDIYIQTATEPLGLSDPEIKAMRAALLELAKTTVAKVSAEYSHSECSDGGADAGSSGGASNGTGGSVTGSGGGNGSGGSGGAGGATGSGGTSGTGGNVSSGGTLSGGGGSAGGTGSGGTSTGSGGAATDAGMRDASASRDSSIPGDARSDTESGS